MPGRRERGLGRRGGCGRARPGGARGGARAQGGAGARRGDPARRRRRARGPRVSSCRARDAELRAAGLVREADELARGGGARSRAAVATTPSAASGSTTARSSRSAAVRRPARPKFLQSVEESIRHQDRVDVLAVAAVVLAAEALPLEAEALVEDDRRLVPREDVQLQLADPASRAQATACSRSARPMPRRRCVAATIRPRSATWRLAGFGSRASERRPTIASSVVGDIDRRVGVPLQRAQVAALVGDGAPAVRAQQPAALFATDRVAELRPAPPRPRAARAGSRCSHDDPVAAAARVAGGLERPVGAAAPPRRRRRSRG